jgi:glutathione S-transferase
MGPKTRFLLSGTDHSMWCQSVAMAMHLKGIRFKTTCVASLRKFATSGYILPALYDAQGRPNEQELTGSDTMLRYLDALGTNMKMGSLTDASEGEWLFRLEELYLHVSTYTRTEHGLLQFLSAWSRSVDVQDTKVARLAMAFARPLLGLSYGFLVTMFRLKFPHLRKLDVPVVKKSFEWWAGGLEKGGGHFFGGAKPGGIDVLLFGLVQTMGSGAGSGLEALRLLADEPGLLAWARRMNAALVDYPWLLTKTLAGADPKTWGDPPHNSLVERVAFWLGVLAFTTVLLPVTLAGIVYHNAVRGRSRNRSLRHYREVLDERARQC